jgi:hypothetical protein
MDTREQEAGLIKRSSVEASAGGGQAMGYGIWGKVKEEEDRAFFERVYKRQSLARWDARWQGLSDRARYLFLNEVRVPPKLRVAHSVATGVSVTRFPADALKELTDAGFVKVEAAKSPAHPGRVVACEGTHDFATRIRALPRYHLLATKEFGEFERYVDYAFLDVQLREVLTEVLRKAGIADHGDIRETLKHYVTNHRWPGWVAKALNDPVAKRVLEVFQEADGPIPMAELAGRLEGSDPGKVRVAVDALVGHLALVEDLRPETWELMVGFLPAVREQLTKAGQPRGRPHLVAIDQPKEVGPDGSVIVNDLRAVLLEMVSEPPRIRQDDALFEKEIERFHASLEPLAAWLVQEMKWSNQARLSEALAWARALGLVKTVSEGKQVRLQLTPEGHQWLSGRLDAQYAAVYRLLTVPGKRDDFYEPHLRWFLAGANPYNPHGPGDVRFLGAPVTVLKQEKGKRLPYYWAGGSEDHNALRTSLDEALAQLTPGVFYRLGSVEAHLVFGANNPLNRGLAPDQVAVFWDDRQIPALEEQREEAGQLLLDGFVRRRLIPLGCVQTAIDEGGRLCIARQPRYDALFGRKVAPADMAPAATVAGRVVVQPDFSVIVIGVNPAPAAELAPFCERASQGAGQGAMILKITRESVVKAVGQGLKPAEIVARLKHHADNEVPPNVLRSVEDWARWVRQVTAGTLAVLRCPDRETADRVMGALKRQGERINDNLVAIDQKKLTATERNKLRSQGILVQSASETHTPKAKSRKRR